MSSDRSTARRRPADDLPPALASMWRLCKLGYTHEPRLVVAGRRHDPAAAVPDALFALWLKFLADALVDRRRRGWSRLLGAVAAVGHADLAAGGRQRPADPAVPRQGDRSRWRPTSPGCRPRWRAGAPGAPDYLDRLAVLRNQVFVLDHMYMSVLNAFGWIVRVGVTVALLASIHPLLVLLVLFAVPTVVSSSWRPAVERQVEERFASHGRLAEHLFATATSPAAAKRSGSPASVPSLGRRRRASGTAGTRRCRAPGGLGGVARGRVGGLRRSATSARWSSWPWGCDASVGSVLLILAAGARLSAYVGATVGEIGFLRGVWLDGSRRLVWLEDYAAAFVARVDVAGARPDQRRHPARPRHASATRHRPACAGGHRPARCPPARWSRSWGRTAPASRRWSSCWPRCTSRRPGTITVDGRPLGRMPPDAWRDRLTGAFQDFFRFEFSAQHSVGVGDLPRLDDEPRWPAPSRGPGRPTSSNGCPAGLASQLGPTWPGRAGAELRAVAEARAGPRVHARRPAADGARRADRRPRRRDRARALRALRRRRPAQPADGGGITISVSHRFSTVRMADLIVVLDGSRLAQVGSHEELMAPAGLRRALPDPGRGLPVTPASSLAR